MGQKRDDQTNKIAELDEAIAGLEKALKFLPDEQKAGAQANLATLRRERAALAASVQGSGALAQGEGATAVGERGVQAGDVGGHVVTGKQTIVYAEQGAKVIIGDDAPEEMSAVARESALGRYLAHIIAHNRYLQLQGIRSGGRLVHIELEHIYITLRATQQRTVQAEEAWLAHESGLAPGERWRISPAIADLPTPDVVTSHSPRPVPRTASRRETATETVTVSVNEALASHRRLVVLSDPGSGKTTLLRYLALVYGRDMAQSSGQVPDKLGLAESGALPILLPLRQIGAFLKEHGDASTEGHLLLLRFLHQYLQNERINVPLDFFDGYLESGRAVILLDGLDEVADSDLRRRVARLVEAFTRAYDDCRFVVTSRVVGYTGPARLGEGYTTTTVRDFTLRDVEQFLSHWHRLVAVGQMGPGESAVHFAQTQTGQLMTAVRNDERIRELAINPLMLTVIALVHRDRVKLPDRRAELYAEAVDVLLGKWDEARGIAEQPILSDKPFDTGDKRLMLQAVAFHMHQNQLKEIETDTLRHLLFGLFREMVGDNRSAERAVTRFLAVIEERTGLLVGRGQGVYAFSHLTFQEYLTALAVAARDDYVAYTLARSGDPWWREVILLEAGYLSTQSKERTSRLIQAVAGPQEEPEPYHNLVLAAECLRDVGENRVQGNLMADIRQLLQTELELAPGKGFMVSVQMRIQGLTAAAVTKRRVAAATALARIGGHEGQYWTQPYGEPEWVHIPAGEFTMGSDTGFDNEKPQHQVSLDAFAIGRVPITNAQYHLFVQATEHELPPHWEDGRPPKDLASHPVVTVTWYDALAYCRWLSQVTGKNITLPSEAEWEKAARGARDARAYPWGDDYDRMHGNGRELDLGTTTPVGIFSNGASPYGVLDMSGNVWDWTRSLYRACDVQKWEKEQKIEWTTDIFAYPYVIDDGREDMSKGDKWARVIRGGSWFHNSNWLRCADRGRCHPASGYVSLGFRVVCIPISPLDSGSSDL